MALAHERRLENSGVRSEANDHGVICVGADTELLDDGIHDRVGRHRPRETLEDPGEALGLRSTARLEGAHGAPMEGNGDAGDDDESGEQPIDSRGVAGHEPEDGHETEDEDRPGEEPPRPPDPPFLGIGAGQSSGERAGHGSQDALPG